MNEEDADQAAGGIAIGRALLGNLISAAVCIVVVFFLHQAGHDNAGLIIVFVPSSLTMACVIGWIWPVAIQGLLKRPILSLAALVIALGSMLSGPYMAFVFAFFVYGWGSE